MTPRPSPADALPLASGYAPCAANPDLWHTKAEGP